MRPPPLVPSHERVSAHKKASVEKLPSPCKRGKASCMSTWRIDSPKHGSIGSRGKNSNDTDCSQLASREAHKVAQSMEGSQKAQ